MRRLLSIVLLAVSVAGFAGGEPASYPADPQTVVLSQASGDSGAPMSTMADCVACSAMGACIGSPSLPGASLVVSSLPPRQSSQQLLDRACAPDTAPPKPSSN